MLATCRALGVGFVAYSPLGRGFLTGRIRSGGDLEPTDVRLGHPRFQGENLGSNLALAERVAALAARRGCTPAQLALAWLLHQPGVVPIPGTKRRPYLAENLGALVVGLTPADLAEIDAAFPAGVATGARYPEHSLRAVHR